MGTTERGEAERAQRSMERAFIRAHHPDVGGDPQAFVEGLAALRRGQRSAPAGPVTVVATHRIRSAPGRLLRRWRRARRAAQRSTRLR